MELSEICPPVKCVYCKTPTAHYPDIDSHVCVECWRHWSVRNLDAHGRPYKRPLEY